MDPRFRYAAPSGRRSPPLHNPARASMPVGIGSSYTSVYVADPHASQPLVGARYDDPITPRTQTTIDYRGAPAVPTPPQLHKTQQPPVPAAAASVSSTSQLPQASHHHQHHQHASQDSAAPPNHHHHTQHQSSMPPPATTTIRSHTVGKDPIARSTSLREPPRTHRTSFSEATQKRPIIITTTTGGSSAAASSSASAARGPPSPTRADHFRPPSAEPVRGSSVRDDSHYYSVPATSAALRSRGSRYSYSGAPMSATLDNDELHRLRGRHDVLHSAPRVDSFPRNRPMSAYVNVPRHSSASIPAGSGATASITSGAGSSSLGSTLVGSAAGSGANSYGDQGYEYTKPSDLARYDITYEQAGSRRGRRDSFDRNYYRPTVNLTTELGRPYGYEPGPRRPAGVSSAAGSSGPPPTTWGLDKINRNAPAGSLASSGSAPVGYDPVASIRGPVIHAATMPIDHSHRQEHGAGSFTSSTALGSSSTHASSRHKASGLYPPDDYDYYLRRDDETSRERRGGDRGRERVYRDRDYRDRDNRDRDYRDSDRDFARERDGLRDGPRDRPRADSIREGEWARERVRGPREYYADGSTANRAFGILVNSREHQLRQAQALEGTVAAAEGPYYDDQRAPYADDGLRRDREDPRGDYRTGQHNGIDRDFVRGRPEPTERLGIESPKRKETDDDMYVHHPQEGMRQWDHSDRHEHEGGDYEHERDKDRVSRDPRTFQDLRDSRDQIDPRDPRGPRDARGPRDLRRERGRESTREREPLGQELDYDPECERERERQRERERERARDREREHDRERERQRAHERDRDQEHERNRDRDRNHDRDHGYEARPSRPSDDEEVANTKKSRDKVSTGLGVTAATAAAAAVAASSAARHERNRNSDGSHHSEDGDYDGRHRPLDYDDDDRGSEASYGSKTSAHTIPAPVRAPPPANDDTDAERRMHTFPVDRTPSSSEDESSDKETKEPGTRKKRQHTTAASFVPTNTEDLKALKAELAALEAKEAREGKSPRKAKDTTEKSSRDNDEISPSREKLTSKSSKADKGEASSPSILTPSSTLSSEASSPKLRTAGKSDGLPAIGTAAAAAAGAATVAAAAASSKGKEKERETRRNDSPDYSPGRASGRTPEIVPEPGEQDDSRRGRDQSQPASRGLVVRLVSPPREKEEKRPVKSILKAPKDKFPEEANPIREGVAPHKDDKTKQQGVPPGARWTRISRKLVNPEALTIGKERFEVRDDFVIVLRVLSREEIEAYTIATAQIRDQHRKEHDRSVRHHDDKDKDKDKDKDNDRDQDKNKDTDRDESRADDERRHHRSRRERDRDRDRERDRDRGDHDNDYYGGSGSNDTRDRQHRHHRYGSESHTDNVADSRQPTIEYHSSRGSNRQNHRN
ncbi:hypothetical protein SCUCBS95973_008536 [Sporothrix curviconia]|uniref:DUF8035 domain-containing protein n=1 Tax=Sporothrix curviconia TaxID=1260050 RepID=A0ABP0CNV3_9PEZI